MNTPTRNGLPDKDASHAVSTEKCPMGNDQTSKEHEHDQHSLSVKILLTVATVASVGADQLCLAMIGPALLDLKLLTGTTTSQISLIFTVRGVMGLLSCIVMGPILDKINLYLLVGLCLLFCSVLTGAAPWSTNLAGILVTLGLPEFTGFTVLMGTHQICLDIWKDKAGPAVQSLNFVIITAYMVAPLIVQPFLTVKDDNAGLGGGDWLATTHPQALQTWDLTLPPEDHGRLVTTAPGMTESTNVHLLSYLSGDGLQPTPGGELRDETDVKFAFWIGALCTLITGICMLAIFFTSKQGVRRRRPSGEAQPGKKRKGISRGTVITLGAIAFMFNLFYGGIEMGYSGLATTFAVEAMNWSKHHGTLLVTVLQASNCLVTIIAIPASKFIKPNVLLACDLVVLNVALVVETLFVVNQDAVLWVCTAGVGIGYGLFMPCTVTWLDSVVGLDGTFASFYWAGYSVGYMALPALSGFMFKEVDLMWFVYINLCCSVGATVTFVMMSMTIYWVGPEVQDTRL